MIAIYKKIFDQKPAAPVVQPPQPQPVSTPAATVPSTPDVKPAPSVASSAQPPASAPYSTDALNALVGMGFPETESRAALTAAMGNPDLAYEFLLTGIPNHARATSAVPSPAAQPSSGIEQLRLHPQFNMLKQLIQQNPAAISQVLELIGQQDPALLQAIHQNNDAFVAMMNEPITNAPNSTPQPRQSSPAGAGAPSINDPSQVFQLLAAMPADQRAQFAQSMGMNPEQMEMMMQMMAQLPPNELQAMMGGGRVGGHADPPGTIRLTEEEMAAVTRLQALGFSQQQAAQAYFACDKNETLAANLLFDGGWGMEEDHGDYPEDDQDDDNMYH